jgi:hypothetical protein
MRMLGMFALVPTTMLLTVSFFVLFALKQVEEKVLKTFGLVVAVLLWVSAALVFSAGIFAVASGCGPWGKMPCGPMGMMQMKHHGMMMQGCPEMKGQMGEPEEGEEAPAAPKAQVTK